MPTLLELDLTTGVLEAPPQDPVGVALSRRRVLLRDILEGLRLGADDPKVVGLVAHVGPPGPVLTHVQELRDAVGRFAATGKPTLAWTESFGELGHGTIPYYLASAFDEIWMQPSGGVGLTGIASEAVFVNHALAKLGVVPEFSARHEYKNAVNMFLTDRMNDAHREAADRLIQSVMEHIVTGIAERRSLDPETVRTLVNRAPIAASDAQHAGLLDQLGYRDEAYAAIHQRVTRTPNQTPKNDGGTAQLAYVHRYRRAKARDPHRVIAQLTRRSTIAVLHGTGSIHLGRSGRGLGSDSIGSDTFGALLRTAAADDDVKAVVVRVNSGGGSYVASDAIRREVIRVREAGKPVIISMGSYAASGGYFIAMAADAIVAQPGTLTGSIGVLGGKMVTRDFLGWLGVTRDEVSRGTHAQMFSSAQEFSDSEWERLETWLDDVYEDFTAKAAADRGLAREQVESAARGRVWTGADAHTHGLVDELGDLDHAVDIAASRALLRREAVEVRTIPRFGLVDRLRPAESSEDTPAAAASTLGLEHGPGALLTTALGLPSGGVLTAPVLWRLR